VGQAKQKRDERIRAERDRPHLEMKLREQFELLTQLGIMYDTVSPVAALPLATSLRVILHNMGSSHAILHQLGLDQKLAFRDTSAHPIPGNLLLAHDGLVVMKMTSGVGGSFVPRLEVPGSETNNPDLRFSEWWQQMVLRDAKGRTWTRERLVLDLANKEGGAHLDPKQPASIRALEQENSMGWTFTQNGVGRPFENGPLAPSVRQIAHEVELTLGPWAAGRDSA
jgi:hypothetical protein